MDGVKHKLPWCESINQQFVLMLPVIYQALSVQTKFAQLNTVLPYIPNQQFHVGRQCLRKYFKAGKGHLIENRYFAVRWKAIMTGFLASGSYFLAGMENSTGVGKRAHNLC